MSARRKVEVFSAGCPACKETIELVNRMACPSCEVTVLDMQDTRIAKPGPELGISTVPAVVIDGKLAVGVGGASNAEIYRKHADEITRFATGLVGPSDAADVVSEAVLRCIGSAQWASVTERRAYLFRAVFNEAARFHRSNRGRKIREERFAKPEGLDSPEIRPDVLAAVAQLSLRQRAVVVFDLLGRPCPIGYRTTTPDH